MAAKTELPTTKVKQLLRSLDDRMALDDLISGQVATTIDATTAETMSVNAKIDADAIVERVAQYEHATVALASSAALIARWGLPEHIPSLTAVLTRLGDAAADDSGGTTGWLTLKWLPLFLVQYSAGVAAVGADRYDIVAAMHRAPTGKRQRYEESPFALARGLARANSSGRDEVFRALPDLQRRSAGASDYLFGFVKRTLPTVIAMGSDIDAVFDRFEIIDAAMIMSRDTDKKRITPPRGMFARKAANDPGSDPLTAIETEARLEGDSWPPARAGLFGGSTATFLELTGRFRSEYVKRLGYEW